MLYHKTMLIAKLDPIKYLCEALVLSKQIVRWRVLLLKFNIMYVKKAIKSSATAEFLANQVVEDYKPFDFDFSNEDSMCICQEE